MRTQYQFVVRVEGFPGKAAACPSLSTADGSMARRGKPRQARGERERATAQPWAASTGISVTVLPGVATRRGQLQGIRGARGGGRKKEEFTPATLTPAERMGRGKQRTAARRRCEPALRYVPPQPPGRGAGRGAGEGTHTACCPGRGALAGGDTAWRAISQIGGGPLHAPASQWRTVEGRLERN
eukprot:350259-Chlamydomonas_euryale.AAC.3